MRALYKINPFNGAAHTADVFGQNDTPLQALKESGRQRTAEQGGERVCPQVKVKGNVPVMHSCGTVVIEACVIMRADQRTLDGSKVLGAMTCHLGVQS